MRLYRVLAHPRVGQQRSWGEVSKDMCQHLHQLNLKSNSKTADLPEITWTCTQNWKNCNLSTQQAALNPSALDYTPKSILVVYSCICISIWVLQNRQAGFSKLVTSICRQISRSRSSVPEVGQCSCTNGPCFCIFVPGSRLACNAKQCSSEPQTAWMLSAFAWAGHLPSLIHLLKTSLSGLKKRPCADTLHSL